MQETDLEIVERVLDSMRRSWKARAYFASFIDGDESEQHDTETDQGRILLEKCFPNSIL